MSNIITKEEHNLKRLSGILSKRGISVRREKLYRNSGCRVKSGGCQVYGKNLLFLDKRLPLAQQTNFLVEYIASANLGISKEELADLPKNYQTILLQGI